MAETFSNPTRLLDRSLSASRWKSLLQRHTLCGCTRQFVKSHGLRYGKSRTRLCFANPSHEAIRAGVATLAEVCRREFGVPDRIANVEQRARA
jgi:hypothetical protein